MAALVPDDSLMRFELTKFFFFIKTTPYFGRLKDFRSDEKLLVGLKKSEKSPEMSK